MRYAFLAVVIACFVASTLVNESVLRQKRGWDADLYCEAAAFDAAGGNPYLSTSLANGLAWTYPPVMLNALSWLCHWSYPLPRDYATFYFLLSLLGVHLWRPGSDWLLAITCAWSGFIGLTWGLWTGNLEILLLIPISLAFGAISDRRLGAAAAWLGSAAAIKLLPLAFLLVFLLLPCSWRERRRAIAIGVASAVGAWLLLTLPRPSLISSYVLQIAGRIPGQYSATSEIGHITQPAFPFVLAQSMGWPNELASLPFGTLLAVAVIVMLLVAAWRLGGQRLASDERILVVFAYVFLAMHLVLPRLKPYAFGSLAPAIFCLMRRQRLYAQALLLIVVVLWPAFAFWNYDKARGLLSPMFTMYSQTLSLLAFLVIVPVMEWWRHAHATRA